ncbi:MAG: glutathione S-transferase C-terminal domain-containing protein [Proteobacteria bacterium]|nr:glutathione S-transferase C-terminal domain-containing protein [Pseudomonadota bacterium]
MSESHEPTSVQQRPTKMLIDGVWHGSVEDTPELRRRRIKEREKWFRDVVSPDSSSEFPTEPRRYHLYVSFASSWAHRAILYRRLKCLEDVISMSVLHPKWDGPHGWTFGDSEMSTRDHVAGHHYLYEIYQESKPDFTGKVTVPVLFDRKTRRIVNNEPFEIMRMLDGAFNAWGKCSQNFYPEALRSEIDSLNRIILEDVAEGVYRAGFAQTQLRYDNAIKRLFAALDELERILQHKPFLLGERVTESDWHLFPVLVRFDAVYHPLLRCNVRRIADYPGLSAYLRRLHRLPGVSGTVRPDQIKLHYEQSDLPINQSIVPAGSIAVH